MLTYFGLEQLSMELLSSCPNKGLDFLLLSTNLILDIFTMEVVKGKTYLLRIVNAALNDELFFAIAGHNTTVVENDSVYTEPFTSQAILIAPGHTTKVHVQANQVPSRYFMATSSSQLPAINDTTFVLSYNGKLRNLDTVKYQENVPLEVDRHLNTSRCFFEQHHFRDAWSWTASSSLLKHHGGIFYRFP
ncbi:hypothetical protein ACLB2K_020536 [Fragaria x ananassa]